MSESRTIGREDRSISEIILVVPTHPDHPPMMAGKYRWYPALQMVAFYPKGKHNPSDAEHLEVKKNTLPQAMRLALRMMERKIQGTLT